MKKALILLIFLIAFLSACAKEKPQQEATTITTLSSQNFSNDDKLRQLKTKGRALRNEHQKLEKAGLIADFFSSADTLEELTKMSDLAIMGTVLEAKPYRFQNEDALTKVTVEVTKVLHGDGHLVNQQIVVFELGGVVLPSGVTASGESKQIDAMDQENAILLIANDVANSYPGDEIVMYLVKSTGSDYNLESDVYTPVMGELSRFIKNDLTGYYERADTQQNTEGNDEQVVITKINDEINQLITIK